MAQLLKTTKRYVINTNTVNNRGFRLLSEGVDQSKYINNPIMLFMHYRATGCSKDEWLPVGCVKEIEIDANGVMTGQPYFDGSDEAAVKLYNKYENGTLNMFSIGALPLEVSLEPEDLLPGQTGPTVTKSLLKEISAVDIGGNAEAYGVALYDENDNEIQLSDDFIKSLLPTDKTKNSDMSKVTTISVVGLLPMLKLADTAGENDVIEAFKGLITLRDEQAQTIITLNDKILAETGKLTALQTKYAELEKKGSGDAIIFLVDKAVADRLITRKEGDTLIELADGKIDGIKKFLDGKTPNPSVRTSLENNQKSSVAAGELVKLRDMNYDQLFEIPGALTKLKDADPEYYKEMYLAKFPKAKI